jgi:hypothetical protein
MRTRVGENEDRNNGKETRRNKETDAKRKTETNSNIHLTSFGCCVFYGHQMHFHQQILPCEQPLELQCRIFTSFPHLIHHQIKNAKKNSN